MSDDKLGFSGAVAIGLGGMIGGGVFSVLGVVVTIAGSAAWLAFTAASLVSMCAGYAYIMLNRVGEDKGGSVTQLQAHVGNTTVAGMVGWTLLVGYIGAMAMYAFAFGSFATELLPPLSLGVPLRPLLSIGGVAGFVALNVLGARATGTSEKVLVGLKIVILLAISAWGIYYGARQGQLAFGLGELASIDLVTATAVSFVSFQGWQLLVYDYGSIADPESTIPKAIYVSIVGAIVVDSLIAILVTSLVPTNVIAAHPEIAVARAVEPFLGSLGFTFIAVAAIFSTGSAINGTLFSSAHFAKNMLSEDLLPDRVGRASADGAPERTVLVLGAATALLSAVGTLEGITSFGSVAFMIVFGAMCAVALSQRDHEEINPIPPALGLLGTAAFLPLLLWHLARTDWSVFVTVLLIGVSVVAVEVLYFEREHIAEAVAIEL